MHENESQNPDPQQKSLALYKKCISDDELVQCQGYEVLYQYAYKVACKRFDINFAKDIAQETIELVYKNIAKCHTPSSFIAFCVGNRGQIRNAWNHIQRQNGIQHQNVGTIIEDIDKSIDQGEEESMLTVHVEQEELIAALNAAIERLPDERMKKLIVWKLVDGLRHKEIGERLGISVGNSRILFNRTLKKLRQDQQLGDFFADYFDDMD